ncbi:MAG: thermonuclease family protein [Paracoccaceae bacterium]
MGILRLMLRAFFGPKRRHYPAPKARDERSAFDYSERNGETETRVVLRPVQEHTILRGRCWVIDGDTIVIDKVHIRLSGIDAPELDHPLGQKAKWALHALCKGQIVTATTDGTVSHDRAVAVCQLQDGRDLSAEMVKLGMALDWPKYSGGRYAHLETPEARKKLWRAAARQRGKMVLNKQGG